MSKKAYFRVFLPAVIYLSNKDSDRQTLRRIKSSMQKVLSQIREYEISDYDLSLIATDQ